MPSATPSRRAAPLPSVTCTQTGGGAGYRSTGEYLQGHAKGKPWPLALHEEQQRQRERDARHPQRHRCHQRQHDAEGVAQSSCKTAWIRSEFLPEQSNHSTAAGLRSHRLVSASR